MLPVNPFLPQSPRLPAHGEFVPSYEQIREVWNGAPTSNTLSLRQFIRSPDGSEPMDLDRLVALIGEAQRDSSPFGGWVFEQAGLILFETKPTESYIANNEFSHALKYLFLGTCFKPALRTIVDSPSTIPLATALIDLGCAFCERSRSLGTTPLIVRAVMHLNMEHWRERRSLSDFFLKPKCLTSPAYLELLRAQTAHEERGGQRSQSGRVSAPFRLNQMFCEATSPSKFLLGVFESNVVVPRYESLGELRRLLVSYLGEDAGRYPFLTRGDGVPEKGPSPAVRRELAPGHYFDVFGTLINHDGTPNTRLIQRMLDLWKSNPTCPVYLVSDSQSDEVKRALGFLPEIPPLLPKDALYGKELECLIDNCEPEAQGLHAKRHLFPGDAVASGTFFS